MKSTSNWLSSDLKGIHDAIAEARTEHGKPTIIRLRTTIGFGSKQQGTHGVHGARGSQVSIYPRAIFLTTRTL